MEGEVHNNDASFSSHLEWKVKIQNLIYSKNVCGICLSESEELNHWDTIYYTECEKKYHSLNSIMQFTFGCDFQNLLPTKYICEKCITSILQSYLMIMQIRSNHNVIEKYMDIISEQVKQSAKTQVKIEKELMLTIDNVDSLNVPVTVTKKPKEANNITQIFLCEVDVNDKFIDWDIKAKINTQIYECPYCSKQFYDYNSLIVHCKLHKERFFRCQKCTKYFKLFKDIIKHRSNVHGENLPTCNICEIILPSEDCEEHKDAHVNNLICNLCQIKFDSQDLLANHVAEKHSKETCEHCLQDFPDNMKLSRHHCLFICVECKDECLHKKYLASYRDQHIANKVTFECCDCDFQYSTKTQLIVHVNEEHLQHYPYLCELCGENFVSQPLLTNHLHKKHVETTNVIKKVKTGKVFESGNSYECNLCGYCFFSEASYRTHRRQHLSGDQECKYCKQIFYNIERLNMHIAKDHPEGNQSNLVYKCSMCLLDFEYRTDYLKHTAIHPKNSEHICRDCNARYASKQSYLCHIRRHKIEYNRECPVCFKMYTLQTIQRHMKTHLKEDASTSKSCEVCGKLFLNNKAYLRHSKGHKEEKQCPHCEKFVKTAFFHEHLSLHKEKEKSFKHCQDCDYKTRFQSCLQAHINRHHLKTRPFQCEVCSKKFYSEYTLKGHQIVHRNTRQEHYCHICGKKFISTKCLNLHMRIHTGEKPYPCEFCDLSFLSASRRQHHMIRKHFEPSIDCHICHKKMYTQSDLRRHMKRCIRKDQKLVTEILENDGNLEYNIL